MPELNGIELLRRVREVHPSIPTIFLSSKNEDADQLIGFSVGADDYVGKPFTKQLLMFRIKSVLRRHAPADKSPNQPIVAGSLAIDPERHYETTQPDGTTAPLRDDLRNQNTMTP